MTPAITPKLLVTAIIGAVVTIGAGITIAIERVGDEPLDLAVPPPMPATYVPEIEFIGHHDFTSHRVVTDAEAYVTDLDDAEAIARAALLVSAFYWDRGYATAHIGTPRLEHGTFVIPVEEGPTFEISSVAVTGELLGSAASHLAMVWSHPGMLFSRTTIAEDRMALNTYYHDRSYAFANVVPQTKLDFEHHTIGLTFEIERGPASTFERIDVIAKTAEREAAMRRALTVAAGQPYSETKMLESRNRMQALGHDLAVSTRRGSTDSRVVATFEELD